MRPAGRRAGSVNRQTVTDVRPRLYVRVPVRMEMEERVFTIYTHRFKRVVTREKCVRGWCAAGARHQLKICYSKLD